MEPKTHPNWTYASEMRSGLHDQKLAHRINKQYFKCSIFSIIRPSREANSLNSFIFTFRFQEKGNLEVLLFTIQSRMRANNQRVYTPKEGVLVADINKVTLH